MNPFSVGPKSRQPDLQHCFLHLHSKLGGLWTWTAEYTGAGVGGDGKQIQHAFTSSSPPLLPSFLSSSLTSFRHGNFSGGFSRK